MFPEVTLTAKSANRQTPHATRFWHKSGPRVGFSIEFCYHGSKNQLLRMRFAHISEDVKDFGALSAFFGLNSPPRPEAQCNFN